MKLRMPSEFLLVEYLVKLELSGVARWLSLFLINYVAALYTPLGDVEEIFNPLGVSLGASES
jgi:hypothetical protein